MCRYFDVMEISFYKVELVLNFSTLAVVQYYAIISHPEKQPAKKQSAIHACQLSNLIASLVSLRAFVRYGHTVTPYSILQFCL
jgi:hypothetical protein